VDKQPSYKHFSSVGEFSYKFSIAPSGETTDRIKKVRRCNNGTDLLYHRPSMVGIVGRAPTVDEKVWCFLIVCFFVTLSNYKVGDNGNAMKEYNFQNNYDTVTQSRVSSCASIFKFFYGPSGFSLMAKFLPKISILAILGAVSPHF